MAPTKEELAELYQGQQLSTWAIAKLMDTSAKTVYRMLVAFDIPVRTKSEAWHLAYPPGSLAIRRRVEASVLARKGKNLSPEHRELIGRNQRGRRPSDDAIRRRREGLLRRFPNGRKWTSDDYERLLPGLFERRRQRPTSLEKKVIKLVEELNLPYKYTGNGLCFIAGRCPDFLCRSQAKVVVEIFGRYWHDPEVTPRVRPEHTSERTLAHYARCGFRCVIIWEEALANMEQVGEILAEAAGEERLSRKRNEL